MKQFLKDYVVPPGVVTLSQRFRPRRRQDSAAQNKLSPEHAIKAVPFGHAFNRSVGVNTEAVTRGAYETRFAVRARRGARFTIGPFEPAITYLQFAVTPKDTGAAPHDLKIFIGGELVAFLNGMINQNEWTDLRVKIKGKEFFDLEVSFEGAEWLYLSSPIGGGCRKSQNSILIILTDSLVPNLIGSYAGDSNGLSLTPNIDRFFSNGRRFNNAHAQSEWTMPAMSSMMTGLYALQHGVYNRKVHQRQLPLDIPNLAELLRNAGYRTFAYSTQGRHSPAYGHHRGYDRFMFSRPYENGHAARVVREGIEFIEAHHEDPFFCYLACMEPHPPSGSLRYFSGLDASPHRLADAVSYYRKLPKNQRHSIAAELDVQRVAKIREMDLHLGSLFDYLERSGAITGITVILTSDHGSTYNYRQVPLLTREITHVPVLVREPGGKATVHDGFVEASTDIYSTVLRLAGIDAPSHAMGRDFLAEDWSPPDRCLVESLYEGIYEVAVRETEWLYIHRCEMEPLTGEIWWDRKLGEYLFRASSFPEPEDSSINLVQTETRAASRLRNHALDHCVQSTRYFDERSFLE